VSEETPEQAEVETSNEPPLSFPLPWTRIAVTLAACAGYWLLAQLSLPGLSPRLAGRPEAATSFGALGLTPVLSGFILVEVAALIAPWLRPRRHTPEGRARLARAAMVLALVIAGVQALGVVRYLAASRLLAERSVLHGGGVDPRLLVWFSLLLGVVAVLALARLIDVAGIGVGFSVLLGFHIALAYAMPVRLVLSYEDPRPQAIFLLALFVAAAWRMLASKPAEGSGALYRLPTPGVEPVHYGTLIVGLALWSSASRPFLRSLLPEALPQLWAERGLTLLATFALCPWFSRLFHRASTPEERASLRRATRASTVWLLALTAVSWAVTDAFTSQGTSNLDPFPLIALVALGLDLARELRAHAARGPQRALRVVHRLEEADALAAVLGAAGIEPTLRGACHRSLFQLFGPFIPVSVMVAEADLEKAEPIAAEHARRAAEPPPLPAVA
jgi:hypothetical protein